MNNPKIQLVKEFNQVGGFKVLSLNVDIKSETSARQQTTQFISE